MSDAARKLEIYSTAMNVISGALSAVAPSSDSPSSSPSSSLNSTFSIQNSKSPLLYGPNNQPILPDSYYNYRRAAAQRTGTMKDWIPKRLFSRQQEALEREQIVTRSIDLTNNDPHASGVVDTFATTIAGSGLRPIPALDPDILDLSKEDIRTLQAKQRAVYQKWYATADASGTMTFGALQYLFIRSLCEYGEYLVLVHMIDSPRRPYMLALRVINPLRLKTPIDKINDPAIKDGVEIGQYGEPVAYWIKRSSQALAGAQLPDTSQNFSRIPASTGHRPNVIHRFISREPEQVRGMPLLAPAMKFFLDLNDYLDTELVSNVVASAISLFIELAPGSDPMRIAESLSSFTATDRNAAAEKKKVRYQEVLGGTIYYGNNGEKPHLLSPNRPGTTFEPFTKIIKKAIAMGINIPYPVVFKDVEGVNFAGFRSAMLDAWRVFMMHRTWLGEDTNQPIYTMLQEEAYLKGEIDYRDFYVNMHSLTHADWRGSPKGDIEPIKAVQADALAIQNNIKTRAEAIAERGGELRATLDQLQEEQEMMEERGLTEEKISPAAAQQMADDENKSDGGDNAGKPAQPAGAVDDQEGAGNEGM
jgi:lambda family phage portal protein